MALSERAQDHVTKFLILHPLNYFYSPNDRAIKFYTELRTEEYNKIYVHRMAPEWATW